MTNFFDSDIVQEELQEINDLQEEIYGSIFTFGVMSREDKVRNVEKLSELLNKQRVMYTRLSLSDDPQAIQMKENLQKTVALFGLPPNTSMNTLFDNIEETITFLKGYLDSN